MNITIKKPEEIEKIVEGGKRLAAVLSYLMTIVKPGITTLELDQAAEKMIREGGDEPAFLHYTPKGAEYPYPATLCVSVNDEVVHGIPTNRVLKEGDIVGLDLGLKHGGLYVDSAVTVPVGKVSDKDKKLMEITEQSLYKAIAVVKAGQPISVIGKAIEKFATPYKYGIVKILGGHGVGYKVHEDPYIYNFDSGIRGPLLKTGMVIAIEPMLNEGTDDVILADDGYTFKTADGKKSAHFEHTMVVTDKGAHVVTLRA